ncbi:hypothetical protein [Micromonospora sp. C41]|uniref:hypothetical protein n=1 Tax=Micromonospora sp. C41 TaxID=2824878 RepID=UPI001B38E1DC|nr:hypothetical protein [Micromonospora sp. C41]MBQ1064448.1 hypothetical protein [Micromonospora sp. C41]
MLRLIRSRTLADLQSAVFELQDRLAAVDPQAVTDCPAFGCVGCGAWMADVVTEPTPDYPHGESYCWRCVAKHRIDGYLIMPGRAQGGR